MDKDSTKLKKVLNKLLEKGFPLNQHQLDTLHCHIIKSLKNGTIGKLRYYVATFLNFFEHVSNKKDYFSAKTVTVKRKKKLINYKPLNVYFVCFIASKMLSFQPVSCYSKTFNLSILLH